MDKIEENRIKPINIELGKLKMQLDKVHAMMRQENFNYQMLESQFENIRNRNNKLKDENDQAEARIKDAISASDKIRKDADDYKEAVKAEVLVMHQKSLVKYNEIMERLNAGERRAVDKHLKELEEVVA